MITSTAWSNPNEIKLYMKYCIHDNIAIRSHIMMNNSVKILIFAAKFSSIFLAEGEKRLLFRLAFVNLQRAKDGAHAFAAKYRYVFVL